MSLITFLLWFLGIFLIFFFVCFTVILILNIIIGHLSLLILLIWSYHILLHTKLFSLFLSFVIFFYFWFPSFFISFMIFFLSLTLTSLCLLFSISLLRINQNISFLFLNEVLKLCCILHHRAFSDIHWAITSPWFWLLLSFYLLNVSFLHMINFHHELMLILSVFFCCGGHWFKMI